MFVIDIVLDFKIENIELRKLYVTGKSKLFALPKKVIDKFFLRLECIEAADNIKDIKNDESMDYQNLKEKNRISLCLMEDWRIEAYLIFNGSPNVIECIQIKDITKTKN